MSMKGSHRTHGLHKAHKHGLKHARKKAAAHAHHPRKGPGLARTAQEEVKG